MKNINNIPPIMPLEGDVVIWLQERATKHKLKTQAAYQIKNNCSIKFNSKSTVYNSYRMYLSAWSIERFFAFVVSFNPRTFPNCISEPGSVAKVLAKSYRRQL